MVCPIVSRVKASTPYRSLSRLSQSRRKKQAEKAQAKDNGAHELTSQTTRTNSSTSAYSQPSPSPSPLPLPESLDETTILSVATHLNLQAAHYLDHYAALPHHRRLSPSSFHAITQNPSSQALESRFHAAQWSHHKSLAKAESGTFAAQVQKRRDKRSAVEKEVARALDCMVTTLTKAAGERGYEWRVETIRKRERCEKMGKGKGRLSERERTYSRRSKEGRRAWLERWEGLIQKGGGRGVPLDRFSSLVVEVDASGYMEEESEIDGIVENRHRVVIEDDIGTGEVVIDFSEGLSDGCTCATIPE